MDVSELKLLDILKRRYKCEVEVHHIETLDGEENPDWSEKFKSIFRNRMAKFVIAHHSVIFPIYRAKDLIIAVEITESEHLQPDEVLQIKDCVELVFNDLYLLKEKKNLIKQRQAYVEAQLGNHSNVIPFRPRDLH